MVSSRIPRLNKKLACFMSQEEGNVTKENIMKMGIVVSTYAIGSSVMASGAGAHSECDSQCPDGEKPENPSSGKDGHVDNHDEYHGNDVANLDYGSGGDVGWVEISHDHCVHDCHASHSSY